MKKLSLAILAAASLTFLATACGSSSSSSSGSGSCTVATPGAPTVCLAFSSSYGGTSAVQTACNAASGTYSSGDCTSSGRVGYCTVNYSMPGAATYTMTVNAYGDTCTNLATECAQLNVPAQGITSSFTCG
jgi:hypothetical protein